MMERRSKTRVALEENQAEAEIFFGSRRARGKVDNISVGGMRLIVTNPECVVLNPSDLVYVEASLEGENLFQTYMLLLYVEPVSGQEGWYLGLQFIGTEHIFHDDLAEEDLARILDQRREPRCPCQISAVLSPRLDEGERLLPVTISNISRTGCRVEGDDPLDSLQPQTTVQLEIELEGAAPVTLLADVATIHNPHALGLRFRPYTETAAGRNLEAFILSCTQQS